MDKPFRPAPLELLARWVFGDLTPRDMMLGIPNLTDGDTVDLSACAALIALLGAAPVLPER